MIAISSSVVTSAFEAVGASLTGVTSKVIVFDVRSKLLSAPLLSATLNVKFEYASPLALDAGVKTSLPALISAAVIKSFTSTATLFNVKVPLRGKPVT